MTWRRPSKCDSCHCVAVWPGSTRVWVRDTTQPEVVLSVPRADWSMFVANLPERAR